MKYIISREKLEKMSRIRTIRELLGINRSELARRMGISRSAISEFENGVRSPSRDFILSLPKIGISTDWFLTGQGEMLEANRLTSKPVDAKILHEKADKSANYPLPDTANGGKIETLEVRSSGVPLVYEGDSGLSDGIIIPLLENVASAGYGAGLGEDDTPIRYVQVPRFLARYPHLTSLPVKGDSMEPTLHDGDLVICDGGGWDGDGIYVLKTFETAYVKRVQISTKGYEVISDNKMYQSFTESVENLSILGKVRAILVVVPGRRGGV